MNNDKLQELGEKLEVSKGDIDSIRKERFKEKWLYPITGALVVLVSTCVGYLMGRNADPVQNSDGYPYSMKIAQTTTTLFSGLPLISLIPISAAVIFKNKPDIDKKWMRIAIIVISIFIAIVGFLVAYDLARPVEAGGGGNETNGGAIKYGVFSRSTGGVDGQG